MLGTETRPLVGPLIQERRLLLRVESALEEPPNRTPPTGVLLDCTLPLWISSTNLLTYLHASPGVLRSAVFTVMFTVHGA